MIFLDNRINIKKKNYYFVNSGLFQRLLHFIKLRKSLKEEDHIFLNGLPPILNLKCKISHSIQNANLTRSSTRLIFGDG